MIIKGENFAYKVEDNIYHCAMDVTMKYIGGKWKTVILWYLINGSKRFSDLKKQIPDITEKMLSIQLKKLEEDGIISRTSSGIKPPLKVEYALTPFGTSLVPMLKIYCRMGTKFCGTEWQNDRHGPYRKNNQTRSFAADWRDIDQKSPAALPDSLLFGNYIPKF